MIILQRYLLREWCWTLLAVSIVLFIVVMGLFLGELLNDMADGRVPVGLLGTQLLLHLPEAFTKILPLAGFVATTWGLGRLYRDNEMVVMQSSGLGWTLLLRPLMSLLIPLSLLLLLLSCDLAPRAAVLAQDKLREAMRSVALWGVRPGQFQELQNGELVVYVEALDDDGRSLRNIFIHQLAPDRERIWIASRGEYWMDLQTDQRYLTLEDGQVTETVPGRLDAQVLEFERNDFMLPEPANKREETRLEAMSTSDLLASTDPVHRSELQWRLSPAIATLLLGLLAIPMAHTNPREGRGSRVVLGILAYALYANTLYLCRAWIAKSDLPAMPGMWWVHAMVLVIALVWAHRQARVS